MIDWSIVSRQVSEAIGAPFTPTDCCSVGGGCINAAWRLGDERRAYFVKTNRADLESMFVAEADALRAILATDTVGAPAPLCVGAHADLSWLVLEFIELHDDIGRSAESLGVQLAALHGATSPTFGWHRDNTIGSTPQHNRIDRDWARFWCDQRLGFQLRLVAERGHGGELQVLGERLLECVPRFFSDYRPSPSLLHGDLWCGNAACRETGAALVFDPASYYGDRETDIAMTELFGGFPAAFYRGYESVWPLDPGYRVRKRLYNLYHVLNHLNLFGGGYEGQARSLIAGLLAEC